MQHLGTKSCALQCLPRKNPALSAAPLPSRTTGTHLLVGHKPDVREGGSILDELPQLRHARRLRLQACRWLRRQAGRARCVGGWAGHTWCLQARATPQASSCHKAATAPRLAQVRDPNATHAPLATHAPSLTHPRGRRGPAARGCQPAASPAAGAGQEGGGGTTLDAQLCNNLGRPSCQLIACPFADGPPLVSCLSTPPSPSPQPSRGQGGTADGQRVSAGAPPAPAYRRRCAPAGRRDGEALTSRL